MLPAQQPGAWVREAQSGLKPGDWRWVLADDYGCLWLAGPRALQHLDGWALNRGWLSVAAGDLPRGAVTALARGPCGGALAGSSTGEQVEYIAEREGRLRVRRIAPPEGVAGAVRAQWTDRGGCLWAVVGEALTQLEPPADSPWRAWLRTGRLPHGNHDLTGAELAGRFYLAGGLNTAFGYPAEPHIADQILAFDPELEVWSVAGRLAGPRNYCAVAGFAGKLWVLGGDLVREGKRTPTATVECFAPQTGQVEPGPTLRSARPMAVAGVLKGRLYAAGDTAERGRSDSPLESIGPDEREWRAEPSAPCRLSFLAGCVLDEALYVCVPGRGLLAFDAATGRWDAQLPRPPQTPRSPQLAGFQGEVWVMGGRDTPCGSDVFCYNPKTRAWRRGPALPVDCAWGAAGVLSGRLIYAGGAREVGTRTFTFSPLTFRLAPDVGRGD